MARHRARFRTSVFPFSDEWTSGPGLTWPIIRFGPLFSWQPPDASDPATPFRSIVEAFVVPEEPFSLLPPAHAQAFGVSLLPPPPDWLGRPIPRWRGVACQLGVAAIWLRNVYPPHQAEEFRLLVLPQAAPPGPRIRFARLGQQFLRQYNWRYHQEYSAIHFTSGPTQRPVPDPQTSCGFLELP